MRKDEVVTFVKNDFIQAIFYAACNYEYQRAVLKTAIETSVPLSSARMYASSDEIIGICHSALAELLVLTVMLNSGSAGCKCVKVCPDDFEKALDTMDPSIDFISTTRFIDGMWVTRAYMPKRNELDEPMGTFTCSHQRSVLPPDYIVQYIYAKLFEIKADSLAVDS